MNGLVLLVYDLIWSVTKNTHDHSKLTNLKNVKEVNQSGVKEPFFIIFSKRSGSVEIAGKYEVDNLGLNLTRAK